MKKIILVILMITACSKPKTEESVSSAIEAASIEGKLKVAWNGSDPGQVGTQKIERDLDWKDSRLAQVGVVITLPKTEPKSIEIVFESQKIQVTRNTIWYASLSIPETGREESLTVDRIQDQQMRIGGFSGIWGVLPESNAYVLRLSQVAGLQAGLVIELPLRRSPISVVVTDQKVSSFGPHFIPLGDFATTFSLIRVFTIRNEEFVPVVVEWNRMRLGELFYTIVSDIKHSKTCPELDWIEVRHEHYTLASEFTLLPLGSETEFEAVKAKRSGTSGPIDKILQPGEEIQVGVYFEDSRESVRNVLLGDRAQSSVHHGAKNISCTPKLGGGYQSHHVNQDYWVRVSNFQLELKPTFTFSHLNQDRLTDPELNTMTLEETVSFGNNPWVN